MPRTSSSLFRRLYEVLGRHGLTYVLSLVAVVFLFTVGLKSLQLLQIDDGSLGLATEVLRSEVFVTVTIAASAAGIFAFTGPPWLRRLLLAILQIFCAFIVFSSIIGFYFFRATGSTLNWPTFAHGFGALLESPEVLTSEVSAVGWFILVLGLLLVAALPPLSTHLVAGDKSDETPTTTEASPIFVISCLLGAILSIVVALIPATWLDYDVGFSRNQGLHLLVTAFTGPSVVDTDTTGWFDIRHGSLQPTEETRHDHIAIIVLESVRASAVTPYNPELDTTPYLDDLADNSVVFEQAYAMVPHTSKALVAILCGVAPRVVMRIVESQPGGHPGRCMPAMLTDQDYRSLFIQAATERFENRRGLVANMGFDDFIALEQMNTNGFQPANYFGVEDDIMLGYAETWLRQYSDAPTLTTYLTITPHHDYLAPDTYGRFEFDDDDVFNRYLNSVRYIDHFVHNVIEKYKALGLYESTLFVIVGDHGEAFGERGREQHDNVPWQEGVHIPLLVHDGSGNLEPRRISDPVSQIDIVPTIYDLLNFRTVDARYPGYSGLDVDPGRIVYFSCWYDEQCAGYLYDGKKYIHHYGNRSDELYDLLSDPREQKNLIGEYDAPVSELAEPIFAWRGAVEAAYAMHYKEIVQQRVLASPPPLTHTNGQTVADTIEIIGHEWVDDADGSTSALRIGLRVLRDFRILDDASFVLEADGDVLGVRRAMLGVYPPLYWQRDQIFLYELPRSWLDERTNDNATLYLQVGDERAVILDQSAP